MSEPTTYRDKRGNDLLLRVRPTAKDPPCLTCGHARSVHSEHGCAMSRRYKGRTQVCLCPLRDGDGVTLTASQEAVLRAIRTLTQANGYPPSVREIGEAVGMRSPATVHAHIESLKRKGVLKPSAPGSNRTLVLASTLADA